jgi:methylated-DNA-protein-cysteine methyltransferase-like protein
MALKSSGSGAGAGLYDRIYDLVAIVPRGRVVTYGAIAEIVGGCTPRMVGYAMAATPWWRNVPWQRVINSQGKVSPRLHGTGHVSQRELLEKEGIVFDARDRVDLDRYGWSGPTRTRKRASRTGGGSCASRQRKGSSRDAGRGSGSRSGSPASRPPLRQARPARRRSTGSTRSPR